MVDFLVYFYSERFDKYISRDNIIWLDSMQYDIGITRAYKGRIVAELPEEKVICKRDKGELVEPKVIKSEFIAEEGITIDVSYAHGTFILDPDHCR